MPIVGKRFPELTKTHSAPTSVMGTAVGVQRVLEVDTALRESSDQFLIYL